MSVKPLWATIRAWPYSVWRHSPLSYFMTVVTLAQCNSYTDIVDKINLCIVTTAMNRKHIVIRANEVKELRNGRGCTGTRVRLCLYVYINTQE